MKKASTIASVVYALVPRHRKELALFRNITGEAIAWLKYQWKKEDIIEYLIKKYTGRESNSKEYPVTGLRANYHSHHAGLIRTLPNPVKTMPIEHPSFELLAWQRRDEKFRREYH